MNRIRQFDSAAAKLIPFSRIPVIVIRTEHVSYTDDFQAAILNIRGEPLGRLKRSPVRSPSISEGPTVRFYQPGVKTALSYLDAVSKADIDSAWTI